MISVIIPIHNAEKHIALCIESILCQSYTDFELILINDGSTDDTDAVCLKYAQTDDRIKYINKPNTGVSNSRNCGIEVAQGQWICFIDADDIVSANYLEAFNVDQCNADLAIAGIDIVNVNNNTSIRKIQYEQILTDLTKDSATLIKILHHGYPTAKAFRKSIIGSEIRFNENISFHEDHIFVFDYILRTRSVYLSDEITYKYQIDYTANSLSKKKHKWNLLILSGDYMFDRLDAIKARFNLKHSDMKGIYTFIYEIYVNGVSALYESRLESTNTRISILKSIFRGTHDISNYYFPQTFRGRVIKLCARYMPGVFLDLFFIAVRCYQDRHNK